jgi:predicted acyl esterase
MSRTLTRRAARAGALAAIAMLVLATPALAAPSKSTYRIPVTQPDEYGRPVELDVDAYVPDGPAPPSGWPLVVVFHGGGSSKDDAFDSGHARAYAQRGYAALLYSARGHGGSSGQTTVAGPKEVRDAFDVLHWAFGAFPLDRNAIALAGYSQGGLHVNMLQVSAGDRSLNPDGFRFAALEPGNTPDVVFNALVDHDVVKLSFGAGLLGTYFAGAHGNVAPQVDRWIATAAADRPELYGGELCDTTGHDSGGSTMRADLAARSAGCRPDRMTLPTLWMQAFDDNLFPAGMAGSMLARMPDPANRLYLSMGGHAAPAAPRAVEEEKTALQLSWLDDVIDGVPFEGPAVVYWSRVTRTVVPAGAKAWPDAAWERHTAASWPPPGIEAKAAVLGPEAAIRLTAPAEDLANDPVAQSAFAPTPLGTAPSGPAPTATRPGVVAVFAGEPLVRDTELSGAPSASLAWTPASPDTQLVLKLLAQAPDGALTLLTRGVTGVRGATPGTERQVVVTAQDTSATLPRGWRLVAWVSAGDASFYKAYPGSAGGSLAAGPRSVLTVPVRPAVAQEPPAAAPGRACTDRFAPASRVSSATVRRGRLTLRGSALDRTCPGDEDLAARGVDRVFVSIARPAGRRCSFVSAAGRLLRSRPCHRRVWLEPRGARRWRLSLPVRRLPPGRYRATVEAVDIRGNVERPGKRNVRAFRVR